jgi:hypothetical protein
MEGHKQFGDMRVGTIVDCLAPPESAGDVIRAAAGLLEQRRVDLIVSNQLHRAWCTALVESGFRMGPSNYLLALSPALSGAAGGEKTRPQAGVDRLKPVPPLQADVGRLKPTPPFHFNRGDGDGPIHL